MSTSLFKPLRDPLLLAHMAPSPRPVWRQLLSDALFLRPLALGLTLSSLLACSHVTTQNPSAAPSAVSDPAESLNRAVFGFNQVVDGYVLKPVASGYRHIPQFMQSGVHNFVGNFAEPKVLINDLLQGNLRRSGNTLARFTFNTTLGLLGLIDVATPLGLPHHSADFGQTFGVWGLANGPVVELPLFGSHNTRDTAGVVLSFLVSPFGGGNSDTVDAVSTAQSIGGKIDQRAEALPLTDKLETRPDYYQALRDYTAIKRAEKVEDGTVGAVTPAPSNHCPRP